jgi:general secretion pathway protein D
MVRATSQDLDIIEAAIEVLNRVPHQVNIKTKFAEISQDDTKAFGFDWYLGNFLMNNRSIVGSGGTQPSLNGAPSTANPFGVFPGSPATATAAATAIQQAGSDQLITGGLRNTLNAPAVATFTGILTDPQFRVVMHAMEQRQGADILSSPEVTTVSGRQAQVQAVDIQAIVTGVNQGGGAQGQQVATGGGTTVQANAPIFQTPTVESVPIGPVLDVIPYISSDGYTIQMTLIPSLTEFLGYDTATAQLFVPTAITGGGITSTALLPLPNFRVRQVTTTAVVWDGQTIVLGGLISDNVTRIKDKVPVLGDIPFIGKLFRSESSETKKKNLVIFVTPTIIDPAGNRLHSEDEMPFAQTAIPRQPPASNQ